MTWRERSASTCLPWSGWRTLKVPLPASSRLEHAGVGDRRARHAGDLAEGEHGARGALVEEAALPDDVALGRQALLEQAHGGPARARARARSAATSTRTGVGHELRRGRRRQVRGAHLDGPGRRRPERHQRHARLAGRRHRQVDVDHAQLVAVAIEAHGRRLALDPRLHDDAHAPRLAGQGEVAAGHALGRERQQRPRRRGGGARRGHERTRTARARPRRTCMARKCTYAGSRTVGRWRVSRRARARAPASTARGPRARRAR